MVASTPPTVPSVRIMFDDIAEEVFYGNSALVCSILGSSPPLEVFAGFAKRMRGKWGISKVASMGKGIYIVRFDSVDSKDKVLSVGMSMFDSNPVIMKSWSVDLDLSKDGITHAGFNFRQYWGQRALTKIASLLGRIRSFIKLDRATDEKEKLQYARVLIDVPIQSPLPDFLSFLNEHGVVVDQEVKFEWRPVLCEGCKNYGHTVDACRKQNGVARKWVRKQPEADKDGFQRPKNPVPVPRKLWTRWLCRILLLVFLRVILVMKLMVLFLVSFLRTPWVLQFLVLLWSGGWLLLLSMDNIGCWNVRGLNSVTKQLEIRK